MLRRDLVPRLEEDVSTGNFEAAAATCAGAPCLMTNIVAAGLERAGRGPGQVANVKEAMEEAGTEEMMIHMTPIGYLSNIGAVAPMLGLLGTVSGMIKAFQSISVGGMGKPELLAGNIGEALVTTATGLIIAIPAMLFYFFFRNRFMRIMASMGRISGKLLDALEP